MSIDPQGCWKCPHCLAGEPSVWDDVLFHYAHPAPNDKLQMCENPWRERCRGCSSDLQPGDVKLCAACRSRPDSEVSA